MKIKTDIQYFIDKYHKYKNKEDTGTNYKFALEIREYEMYCFGVTRYFMELDEEDIKYLYDKYSKRVKDEFQSNIEEITKLYNQLFPDEKNY